MAPPKPALIFEPPLEQYINSTDTQQTIDEAMNVVKRPRIYAAFSGPFDRDNFPPLRSWLGDKEAGEMVVLLGAGWFSPKKLKEWFPNNFIATGGIKADSPPLGLPSVGIGSDGLYYYNRIGKRILCGQAGHRDILKRSPGFTGHDHTISDNNKSPTLELSSYEANLALFQLPVFVDYQRIPKNTLLALQEYYADPGLQNPKSEALGQIIHECREFNQGRKTLDKKPFEMPQMGPQAFALPVKDIEHIIVENPCYTGFGFAPGRTSFQPSPEPDPPANDPEAYEQAPVSSDPSHRMNWLPTSSKPDPIIQHNSDPLIQHNPSKNPYTSRSPFSQTPHSGFRFAVPGQSNKGLGSTRIGETTHPYKRQGFYGPSNRVSTPAGPALHAPSPMNPQSQFQFQSVERRFSAPVQFSDTDLLVQTYKTAVFNFAANSEQMDAHHRAIIHHRTQLAHCLRVEQTLTSHIKALENRLQDRLPTIPTLDEIRADMRSYTPLNPSSNAMDVEPAHYSFDQQGTFIPLARHVHRRYDSLPYRAYGALDSEETSQGATTPSSKRRRSIFDEEPDSSFYTSYPRQ
ncbi:Kinetochore protein mis13 isoform A [Sphaceloma murrayae]|uniref:Kinetochore protein mis13 isoform A n=1 Tax=Sphaceloma murrayae TaxID=2082308 RepID=A0A2K1QNU2_9PEZI|nr:Kinetochore protein mis13 isoform A [Sphaceloma murrayae]